MDVVYGGGGGGGGTFLFLVSIVHVIKQKSFVLLS